MARSNADDRFVNDDENQKSPKRIDEPPGKDENLADEPFPKNQALTELTNARSHPSRKGNGCIQDILPVSSPLGRPAAIGNTSSVKEVGELEGSSITSATGNSKENAHDEPSPASTRYETCKGEEVGIISAGGPLVCTSSAPSPQESRGAEGGLSGILTTATPPFDTTSYFERREKETNEFYWPDLYTYLRMRERQLLPDPSYMLRQPHIASHMRSDVVNWLVKLANHYILHDEKLFLAVSYLDRFLSRRIVPAKFLPLVGAAALFTACKFEGGKTLRCDDLLYATGNRYTKDVLMCMERGLLNTLRFEICAPTVYYFLRRFSEASKAPADARLLAQYLCELALLDDDPYLRFSPSVTAGAALCLANHTLGQEPWGRELGEYSGYEVANFQELLPCLRRSFTEAPGRSQKAVAKKFNTPAYNHVASLQPSSSLPT